MFIYTSALLFSHFLTFSQSISCPDESKCPEGMTCCPLSDPQHYACCPLPQAVCCSDYEHCCPEGYTCDSREQTCRKNDGEAIPWLKKLPSLVETLHTEHCTPSTQCISGPCCNTSQGYAACCPLDGGVCCEGADFCCPHGTICDVHQQKCKRETEFRRLANRPPSLYREPGVLCPGGHQACQAGQTCCPLSSEGWGCCPVPKANCCSDFIHCCPHAMICDMAEMKCKPQTPQSSLRAVKILTEIEAKIQVGCGNCAARSCCKRSDGFFGCCPFREGECCHYAEKCCPKGHRCTQNGECHHPTHGFLHIGRDLEN